MKTETQKPKKLVAFPYYGGKNKLVKKILPWLPYVHGYIEPFGGSAAILLNRKPSPFEIYNDLDGEVVNFFRVLRQQPEELIRQLELTPYSREEFANAIAQRGQGSDLERARNFYIRVDFSRKFRDASNLIPSDFQLSRLRNAAHVFLHRVPRLREVVERLKMVHIENKDAIWLLEKFNFPNILFYCDPPYHLDTRSKQHKYGLDYNNKQHEQLLEKLNASRALIALSGYDNELYSKMLQPPKWRVVTFKANVSSSIAEHHEATEFLWMNYRIEDYVSDDLLQRQRPADFDVVESVG